MNLLAAIALLFLDEETTFWYTGHLALLIVCPLVVLCALDRFLQAIIEKILPAGYFTPGLLGAQADQVHVACLHYCLSVLSY